MHRITRSLSVALGARDQHTRMHSDRVVHLATELGRQVGLSGSELELLALSAELHDLGKIGIPDKILRKPEPFDAQEWECMQSHVAIGEQIILAIDGENSPAVARIVRHHHEHFDGSGYPDRLSGNDIPLQSRIISLADSYDAMLETRPYHRPRRHLEIMEILHGEAGIKHDPALLRVFANVVEQTPISAPN